MEQSGQRVEVRFTRVYLQVAHACPHCGDVFTGAKAKVYCSSRCANRAAWERNGEKYLRTKQRKERTI